MSFLKNLTSTLDVYKANLADIKCATFGYIQVHSELAENENGEYPTTDMKFELLIGHTEEQRLEFLKNVDIEYDPDDIQGDIGGTIWFTNGAWAEIEFDYDSCISYWSYYLRPEIPESLM